MIAEVDGRGVQRGVAGHRHTGCILVGQHACRGQGERTGGAGSTEFGSGIFRDRNGTRGVEGQGTEFHSSSGANGNRTTTGRCKRGIAADAQKIGGVVGQRDTCAAVGRVSADRDYGRVADWPVGVEREAAGGVVVA